jgi:hypothetical protein
MEYMFTKPELVSFKNAFDKLYSPDLGCQGFTTGLDLEREIINYVCKDLNINTKEERKEIVYKMVNNLDILREMIKY